MADLLVLLAEKKTLLIIMSSTFIGVILLLVLLDKKLSQRKPEPQALAQPTIESEMERFFRLKTEEFSLEEIDEIARSYFSQKYGLSNSLEYEDLYSEFKKRGNNKAADFAKRMVEYKYSGEAVDNYKIAMLISIMKKIYDENKSKEQPKEQDSLSFLKKMYTSVLHKEEPNLPNPPAEEIKEERLILEQVKNLKPVTIKPEVLSVKPSKKKQVDASNIELDNLERIKMKISDKKSNLV